MVHDDEEEVFDLGFIIDDRDDRRDSLLASWQPLDDMDTDGIGRAIVYPTMLRELASEPTPPPNS